MTCHTLVLEPWESARGVSKQTNCFMIAFSVAGESAGQDKFGVSFSECRPSLPKDANTRLHRLLVSGVRYHRALPAWPDPSDENETKRSWERSLTRWRRELDEIINGTRSSTAEMLQRWHTEEQLLGQVPLLLTVPPPSIHVSPSLAGLTADN